MLCTLAGWNPSDSDFEADGIRVEAAFKAHFHRLVNEDSMSSKSIPALHPNQSQMTNDSIPDENPSETTVLVCHGNIIRYLTLRALQLPVHAWLRLAVYNGSITVLEIRHSGRISLTNLGEVGHLPPELITYSLRD